MKKLISYFRIYLLEALTYRGDLFFYTLGGIAQPIISIFVWVSIAGHSPTPLSQLEFVHYFLLVMLVNVWTSSWAGKFISTDIRLGKISPILLKPISFIFPQISNNVAEKTIKSTYMTPVMIVLVYLFKVDFFSIPASFVFYFAVSLIMAAIIMFITDICLGMAAFWFDDNAAIFEFFSVSMFFFSGKFIPLIAFPVFIQELGQFLPFRYVISFPIEIFLNQLTHQQIYFGLLIQSFWLLATIFAYKILWRRGVKQYSASGS